MLTRQRQPNWLETVLNNPKGMNDQEQKGSSSVHIYLDEADNQLQSPPATLPSYTVNFVSRTNQGHVWHAAAPSNNDNFVSHHFTLPMEWQRCDQTNIPTHRMEKAASSSTRLNVQNIDLPSSSGVRNNEQDNEQQQKFAESTTGTPLAAEEDHGLEIVGGSISCNGKTWTWLTNVRLEHWSQEIVRLRKVYWLKLEGNTKLNNRVYFCCRHNCMVQRKQYGYCPFRARYFQSHGAVYTNGQAHNHPMDPLPAKREFNGQGNKLSANACALTAAFSFADEPVAFINQQQPVAITSRQQQQHVAFTSQQTSQQPVTIASQQQLPVATTSQQQQPQTTSVDGLGWEQFFQLQQQAMTICSATLSVEVPQLPERVWPLYVDEYGGEWHWLDSARTEAEVAARVCHQHCARIHSLQLAPKNGLYLDCVYNVENMDCPFRAVWVRHRGAVYQNQRRHSHPVPLPLPDATTLE